MLVLAAVLPLRAVAAVTIGFCPADHQGAAVEVHAAHDHGAHGQPAKHHCGTCAEHCSSAAFAPSAAQPVIGMAITESSAPRAEPVAPAFISDQLDRPPLA
jgi:hypothetical protein